MALAGEEEEVEAFIGLDERVGQPDRVARVDVVVDVAGRQEQVALEVLGDLGVLLDGVLELDGVVFVDHFLDPVVLLAPPAVVDVVLVVA